MSTKPAYITEQRLAVLLSRFAQAADASLNLKMEQMREEILSELRKHREVTVAPTAGLTVTE